MSQLALGSSAGLWNAERFFIVVPKPDKPYRLQVRFR
jgi:hypothetical protein